MPNEQADTPARIARIEKFHETTRNVDGQPQPAPTGPAPRSYRIFGAAPKTPLPTNLIDMDSVPAMSLLAHLPEAVPAGELNPPQDLRTLATWLYMSCGMNRRAQSGTTDEWHRTVPSAGATYPCEVYVAAFHVDGIEPGLYHFSVREFALRRLRAAPETFVWTARALGNPQGLDRAPAALLITANLFRAAWKYANRGLRSAILDAGHLVENIVTSGRGLGMSLATHLRLDDLAAANAIIGVDAPTRFGEVESPQAAVIWTDPAQFASLSGAAAAGSLPAIPREPLAEQVPAGQSILDALDAATAPKGSVREIRPPLTDLTPLPENAQTESRAPQRLPPGGPGITTLVRTRRSAQALSRDPIPMDALLWCNQIAFRTGTYPPMFPAGPHVALVRAFWVLNGVDGFDPGVWYYDAPTDRWAALAKNDTRMETSYLAMNDPLAGDAAAVCFIASNLHILMSSAGPDMYRMAHLEAGIVSHRMQLAAIAQGLGARGIVDFYDQDVRKFLGLERTNWQVLYATAIGLPVETTGANA